MIDFSIIVPIYNAEKYLKDCISSILGQTYKNIEVICVNDASKDSSLSILEQYALHDSRLSIINEEINVGTSKARKDGVLISKGTYILFVDADDKLDRQACNFLKTAMECYNTDILQFGVQVEACNGMENKKVVSMQNYVKPLIGMHSLKEVREKCFNQTVLSHHLCGKVFKGDICRKAFSYLSDERYIMAEDMYAYFAITELSFDYYGVNDILYYYRYGYGITGKGKDIVSVFKAYCSQAKIIEACYDLVKRIGNNDNNIVTYIEKNMIHVMLQFIEDNVDTLKKIPVEILVDFFNEYWDYSTIVKMVFCLSEKCNLLNEIIDEKMWQLPYRNIPFGSRIVLYGAGDVGRDYYNAVVDSKYCVIVAWADREYEKFDNMEMEIINPLRIIEFEFDYVLIAVYSIKAKNEIKDFLASLGVEKRKLI